ncbi:choline transporter [Pseudoclavibacter sp. RFBJ3]|uniref:BCCT family transporter n=1 Tax=unclassified Pseudoclavibacter TaxID=2615177 RepID=UPI000CE8B30E|nr:choline transporter [Pseudoclavibacter sp. RFBJ5]PPF91679.1 choline transporter [Pseudoclavibacter sp. RFBJ3]PPF97472.1 choline transporter [Pseudoclavibacter sp. RFBH5]PPG22458.1 choline transporter [Pseudoclavibacter sp. RFBI4]
MTSSSSSSAAAPDTPKKKGPPTIKRWVFWPAAIIVIGFAGFSILAPTAADAAFNAVQSSIVRNFNWYYVLIAAFFVIFSLVMGFGKYGDIKLGKDDDKPEFSNLSWLSLLFAAGMGIGLVFYGVSEPLSHFIEPKPGVSGTESQIAQQALSQTYLHWGVHAWSIYIVLGLALAYAIHRRGRPVSVRWALEPLLGRRVRGGWGNLIDVVALVGTIFGVATSLGLGVLQIGSGLEAAGILESSTTASIAIIAVITAFVLFSVLSGVGKGMKWLSNTNLMLAGALLVFILIVGPTQFLLRDFVQSLGNYLQNFVSLTFSTSAFSGEAGVDWQSAWTTFYWGWWMSWAPFVGVFIARISRGRTVREFVTGVMLVPTLVTFLWFSVLGGTALYMQLNGITDFVQGDGSVDVEGALFQMLAQLPGGAVLTIGAIILIAIFFITSADSGALVMGMLATGGQAEPKHWVRAFFAIITSLLAVALLLAGGLNALQTAAISIALPFSIVLLLSCWATALAFAREKRAYDRASRAALVGHIGDFYGLEVDEPVERAPGKMFPWLRKANVMNVPVAGPQTSQVAVVAQADEPKNG